MFGREILDRADDAAADRHWGLGGEPRTCDLGEAEVQQEKAITTLRRQERRLRAQKLAQEKLDEVMREHTRTALNKMEIQDAREAEERRRIEADRMKRRKEQEVIDALRRGAAAETTLAAMESDHWAAKVLMKSAREQARHVAAVVEQALGLGASQEELAASLRVLVAEQTASTSQLAGELLRAALSIGSTTKVVVERRRTRRPKEKKKAYGSMA